MNSIPRGFFFDALKAISLGSIFATGDYISQMIKLHLNKKNCSQQGIKESLGDKKSIDINKFKKKIGGKTNFPKANKSIDSNSIYKNFFLGLLYNVYLNSKPRRFLQTLKWNKGLFVNKFAEIVLYTGLSHLYDAKKFDTSQIYKPLFGIPIAFSLIDWKIGQISKKYLQANKSISRNRIKSPLFIIGISKCLYIFFTIHFMQ